MIDFEALLTKRRGASWNPPEILLCLDPGYTTGVCIFRNGKLDICEQVPTIIETTNGTKVLWPNLVELFDRVKPTAVICEDYRVYAHKLDQHTFSSVDTLRLIGGIDMTSKLRNIPIAYQMAAQAKGFVTDEKLKAWNMWQRGMRHSRDAIRHGCYFLLFSKEE